VVAVVTGAGPGTGASPRDRRAKRLFAAAYDASAGGFARSADRLVYAYLARPLARALAGNPGPVLDVAAGSGALGRLLPAEVALDLSAAQLRHNPLHPVAVRVGDLGHPFAPRLVGRLGQHADAVGAQVLHGGVAVLGVHPEGEAQAAGGLRVVGYGRVGADAEVGPAQVQGHIARLAVGVGTGR
jgi:hypothetical protein